MGNVDCSRLEALLYVRTWNFYRDSTWNFGTPHGAVTHRMHWLLWRVVGGCCRKPFYPIEDLVLGGVGALIFIGFGRQAACTLGLFWLASHRIVLSSCKSTWKKDFHKSLVISFKQHTRRIHAGQGYSLYVALVATCRSTRRGMLDATACVHVRQEAR